MRTFKSWPQRLLSFTEADGKISIWMGICFLLGAGAAMIFALSMPEAACQEMLLYLQDFFESMAQRGADSGALFRTALIMHCRNFMVLFLCSAMVIGAPFIAALGALCSFMQAFTIVFLFRLYGALALLFFGVGMLPHYLLSGPCYVLLFLLCLRFSLSLHREKNGFKKKLPSFLCKLGILFVVALLSALLQAYVEPLLIRLVSGLFI